MLFCNPRFFEPKHDGTLDIFSPSVVASVREESGLMAKKRKAPRLFAFPPEVEMETLRGAGLNPDEEKELRAVLLSFGAIAKAKRISQEVLAPVVGGCASSSLVLRSASLHRLVVLSHYFEEAAEALEELCIGSEEEVRVLAITYLANGPQKLMLSVLRSSLADEAPAVRSAAARLGKSLRSRRCQRLLNRRLAVEPVASVRRLLQGAIKVQIPEISSV